MVAILWFLWGNDDKLVVFGGCRFQTIPFAQFDGLNFIYVQMSRNLLCHKLWNNAAMLQGSWKSLESRLRPWSLGHKVRRRYANSFPWAPFTKTKKGLELHSQNNEVHRISEVDRHFKGSPREWKVNCILYLCAWHAIAAMRILARSVVISRHSAVVGMDSLNPAMEAMEASMEAKRVVRALEERLVFRDNYKSQAQEAPLPSMTYPAHVNLIIGGILRAASNVQGVEVRAFGSSANGFGDASSDVDVVLAATGTNLVQGLELGPNGLVDLAPRVLRKLERRLQMQGFKILQRILHARIPILKMSMALPSGKALECDLSVNNLLPVFNTKLLKTYAEINPHVVDLVQTCKEWAKEHGVHGAARGHLSSYAFTLMVIFFLQIRGDLPCLQGDAESKPEWYIEDQKKYNVYIDETSDFSEFAERNMSTFGDFIRFYRNEFRWGEWVVSIRTGKCLSLKRYPRLTKQPRSGVAPFEVFYFIHIEDPFDIGRNLHCVLGPQKNQKLWDAFVESTPTVRRWRRGYWCFVWPRNVTALCGHKACHITFLAAKSLQPPKRSEADLRQPLGDENCKGLVALQSRFTAQCRPDIWLFLYSNRWCCQDSAVCFETVFQHWKPFGFSWAWFPAFCWSLCV